MTKLGTLKDVVYILRSPDLESARDGCTMHKGNEGEIHSGKNLHWESSQARFGETKNKILNLCGVQLLVALQSCSLYAAHAIISCINSK